MSTIDRILSVVCLSFGVLAAFPTVVGGIIALSFAVLIAIHAVVGRALGFHRQVRWVGGGNMTLVGELSMAGCIGAISGIFVFGNFMLLLIAIPCSLIGFISQERANKRPRDEQE
jgi:hypothetical protein